MFSLCVYLFIICFPKVSAPKRGELDLFFAISQYIEYTLNIQKVLNKCLLALEQRIINYVDV